MSRPSYDNKSSEERPLAGVTVAIPKIPAAEYVGHGVSLISPQNPFNANDILESTENYELVSPVWADEVVLIPGIDSPFSIPSNFRLEARGPETKYHDLLVETGSVLAERAAADPSVRASYFGVDAKAADYEYDVALQLDCIYGLFTLEQRTYSVSLRPRQPSWDNIPSDLLVDIQNLPAWLEEEEGGDEGPVHRAWREFFESWGTHVVLEAFYGNRYQLRVMSSDTPSLTAERWRACIEADYADLIPQTVEPATEAELAEYNSTKTTICYVFGGDRQKAMALVADHKSKVKLDEWAASLAGITDAIINLKVKSLYNLLKESPAPEHQTAAEKIRTPLGFYLSIPAPPTPTPPPPPPPTGDYKVSVVNQRGADTTYAFFMDRPQFTGGSDTWMNVWTSANVVQGANYEVTFESDNYAWVGTAPTPPGPGVVVGNWMSELAQLGTEDQPGSTFEMKIVNNFPTIAGIEPPTAQAGAFEIQTDSTVPVPNNKFLIGIGKKNHRDQVVPITSMAPNNNLRYQITPKAMFFISESQQIAGEIADYASVSRDGATIDFSSGEGKGKTRAVVTQNNLGQFETAYFDE